MVQTDESPATQQLELNFPAQAPIANGTCSADELITFLHGKSPKFEYQMVIDGEFSLPLYRERNFE